MKENPAANQPLARNRGGRRSGDGCGVILITCLVTAVLMVFNGALVAAGYGLRAIFCASAPFNVSKALAWGLFCQAPFWLPISSFL